MDESLSGFLFYAIKFNYTFFYRINSEDLLIYSDLNSFISLLISKGVLNSSHYCSLISISLLKSSSCIESTPDDSSVCNHLAGMPVPYPLCII